MKVLVFGGRGFNRIGLVFKALDQIDAQYGITTVIDGVASGADTIAHKWALARGKESQRFPAQWDKYGRSAGPIRNKQMLDEGQPELGVAFPGGPGTENMKMQLKRAGIKVLNVVPTSGL